MTFFEYITVAVSIVLALAVARSIDGLRSALERDRRYWVHFVWVVVKLCNPITFWWGIWGYRDATTWNIVAFTLVLAWPAMLYLQVTSLVTRQPEAITDWRAHFYSQRLWFFGVNLVLIILAIGLSLILGAGPLAGQFGIARLLVIALSVAGLATSNEKAHAVIVALSATNLVFGFWAQAFTPLVEAP